MPDTPTTVSRKPPELYLASRSPRRVELLGLMGVDFAQLDVEVDERRQPGEPALDYVARVAALKAGAGYAQRGDAVVLAADTAVCVGDEIFGKPRDLDDARRMLQRLSGACHTVHTAVRLITGKTGSQYRTVSTQVEFVELSDAMIDAYWTSGEPQDKAGAYGIQGIGGTFVRRIEGSFSAVVGLPLAETADLLTGAGIRVSCRP